MTPGTTRAAVYGALYVGYIVLGFAMRWNGWIHLDQIWFVDAARHVLDGSWRLYDFRPPAGTGIAPPDGLAYSYSPLPALLMAPFVALADALGNTAVGAQVGGAEGLAARLIALPLLVADVLAMDQLRRLARAWAPQVDEGVLLLGIIPTLLVTGFLQVSANRGHQEGLVLFFLLLTLRVTPRNLLSGGLLAGLTLAAKQTAVLELAPVGLVLLTPRGLTLTRAAAGRFVVWAGTALAVFAAFMVPPVLANPQAVVYAFLTQEGRRVLNGPGLPVWLDGALAGLLGTESPDYAVWHARLLAWSNPLLLAAAIACMAGIIVLAARRARPIG
ncbi:MAG TPA: hypothetical protein VM536_17730, partial [Chloroflexia bacterium]|nr:hypothetical protein [Chloroflexia bacterium]